jgi:hypothetical protein
MTIAEIDNAKIGLGNNLCKMAVSLRAGTLYLKLVATHPQ